MSAAIDPVTRSTIVKLGHVIRIRQAEEWAEHRVKFDPVVPDDKILDTLAALDPAYREYERYVGTCEGSTTRIHIERLPSVTRAEVIFQHYC